MVFHKRTDNRISVVNQEPYFKIVVDSIDVLEELTDTDAKTNEVFVMELLARLLMESGLTELDKDKIINAVRGRNYEKV